MRSLTFHERFVPAIVAGVKRYTVRRRGGSVPPLRSCFGLYTGGQDRPIGHATCLSIELVDIDLVEGIVSFPDLETRDLTMHDELDVFARVDGFATWLELTAFYRRIYPGDTRVSGTQISWGSSFRPATVG